VGIDYPDSKRRARCALSPLGPQSECNGYSPLSISVEELDSVRLNGESGQRSTYSASAQAGANANSVAVDPAGKFLYVGNNSLGSNSQIFVFSIDAATGTPTQVGTQVPSGDTPAFITIDPSGDLAYVANLDSSTITVYAVNKTTGALTATGSPIPNGADTFPAAIAILK
jgi:6-phosphogluconolactonase (cycloisomerase 2 family)